MTPFPTYCDFNISSGLWLVVMKCHALLPLWFLKLSRTPKPLHFLLHVFIFSLLSLVIFLLGEGRDWPTFCVFLIQDWKNLCSLGTRPRIEEKGEKNRRRLKLVGLQKFGAGLTVFPRIIAGGDYFFFRTKRGRLFEERWSFQILLTAPWIFFVYFTIKSKK